MVVAKLAVLLERGKTNAKARINQPAPETETTPCRTRGERSNLTENGRERTSSVVSGFASAAKSDMIGVCVLLREKPLRTAAVLATRTCCRENQSDISLGFALGTLAPAAAEKCPLHPII